MEMGKEIWVLQTETVDVTEVADIINVPPSIMAQKWNGYFP
mgnify:CR=1 FL=1